MRKRLTSIVISVILASTVLSGCGGSTPTATKTVDTKATTPVTTGYKQSPMLDAMTDLPKVADRLPKEPKITNEMPADMLNYQIGTYGGNLRTVSAAINWDADVFVMNNEALLNTPGILGKDFTGNILKDYKVNADQTVFTFTLRDGLKWSDGQPVTMEDFKFTWNDILLNKELTPVFPDFVSEGGVAGGAPATFNAVDNLNFTLTFKQPYGGLPVRLSIQGWRGYTDLLKPEHYMKQFHKKYADPTALAKLIKDNKFTTWVQLWTLKNVNNWDLTGTKAIGYPSLYPWIYTKKVGNVSTFTRNPYYFKVDTAGNQLPYIDTITSTAVQDIEMVGMKTIAGEVDFSRESAALIKMPLYKANEAKGGYTALLASMHVTPTDIMLNQTYNDPTFHAVVSDLRFRQALNFAIDRKTIIDTIYYSFAKPGTVEDSTFDMAKANALLDEMGMNKGSDGFRTAPDGKKFSFLYEVGASAPDIVPMSQLVVQGWQKLGINVTLKTISPDLLGTKGAANQLQCTMMWIATPLWYYGDTGIQFWGVNWNTWQATGGTKGTVPPAGVKEFLGLINSLNTLSPDKAIKKYDEVLKSYHDNLWLFIPVDEVKQPLIVNSKLGNVSDKGFAIASNFSGEQFFFKK